MVHESQCWQVSDARRRWGAQFGKLKGLHRAHLAAAEALQEYLMGRPDHCAAQVALLLQGFQQVALDQGDWANATFLVTNHDPLGRPEIGAGEAEMAAIARYRRGLRELKKKFSSKAEADVDEGGEEKGGKRGPKKK